MLMLIEVGRKGAHHIHNFNTSHVNVNLIPTDQEKIKYYISIHLMLMLIDKRLLLNLLFNCISIHLMLMLIKNIIDLIPDEDIFQYISC